jgi:hypothetical protein
LSCFAFEALYKGSPVYFSYLPLFAIRFGLWRGRKRKKNFSFRDEKKERKKKGESRIGKKKGKKGEKKIKKTHQCLSPFEVAQFSSVL